MIHFEGPLRDSVDFWAKCQPGKIAYIDSDGEITYAELSKGVRKARVALLKAGVSRGDRIAIIAPSCIEFAVLLFAVMGLGVNLIPFDVLLTEREVQRRLDITHPKLVFAARLSQAECSRASGYRVIGIGEECSNFESFADFISSCGEEALCLPRSEGGGILPVLTIFTSGTTGQPKGVLLSEANLEHAVTSINMAVEAKSDDVFLTSLPISHIYGVNTGILLPVLAGAVSVLLPKFKSEASLDAVERHRVTIYNGVPSVYKRMANAQQRDPRDLSSMRAGTIAGAKCTNLEEYERVLNCKARILYGATECPIIAMTREGDSLDVAVSGVGRFNPTVVPRIVDDEGRPVPDGSQGEIICKSPGAMIGYLDNSEATLKCIDKDGWMHTGDIGYVDENGYVQIIGRKTDVINRGGYKVYPAEIESAYGENPDIFDCCVMGMPHAELGQQIVLFAALRNKDANPYELRCYAKDKVAKYKIPDQVIVLDRIPYLATGKPDKQAMIKLFETDSAVFHDDAERKKMQGEGGFHNHLSR